MKYGITKLVLGFSEFIDISEQEYKNIKSCRDRLIEALYIEEKFDLIVENYLEYEMELLASSARHMVFRNQDYIWFQTERSLISRRIVNLLSACRMYLDQSVHHLKNIYGNDSYKVEEICSETSTQYDTKLGYRTMEALRNYVQHRGLPIHKIVYPVKRVETKSDAKILFTVTPYIDLSALEEDKKFKIAVLQELKIIGKEIDIKPLLRQYIGGISIIHEKIREIINEDKKVWEETLTSVIDLFKSKFGPETSIDGIGIAIEVEDGICIETVSIFVDFINRRQELEEKNNLLRNLPMRYVTNEIIE